MKEIGISSGRVVLIDDEDFDYVTTYRWALIKRGKLEHAYRKIGTKSIYLHRCLIDAPEGRSVDHINGNGLDNRKCNLRLADKTQNGRNRGKNKNNKSGYKGVFWNTQASKWNAKIHVPKQVHLGYYTTPEEAALAYNKGAIKYFGKFAKLNEIQGAKHNGKNT